MKTIVITGIICIAAAACVHPRTQVTGLASIVLKDSHEKDHSNITFKGYSNFHSSRARIFLDAAVAENTYCFVQVIMDNYDMSLYAAYVRFAHLYKNYLNLHAGYIPTTVGTWAERTYSNRNPLIGTPLLYNYHSNLHPGIASQALAVDDFLAQRDTRYQMGLPIIYNACWNTGLEIYGSAGKLDYSLGLLTGSVSKPTQEQKKDIPQITGRLGYYFNPGLVIGISAYIGPYLYNGAFDGDLPEGKKPEDYLNSGIGYDFYFARGKAEIYSELFYSVWEHPWFGDLEVTSGYLESSIRFLPQWYAAGRVEFFEPGEITASNNSRQSWDYPLKRLEYGVGYRPNRNTVIKLVNQLNRYDNADHLNHEHLALQLSIALR